MERKDWVSGIKKMAPVLLSYIPLGLAGGMLLSEAGFSPLGILLMSLLVFAGAGQFMAASMVSAGASVFAIILMTFFLNLRHLLLSSSISTYLKGKKLPFLLLFSHTTADESYAVNYTEFTHNPAWSPEEGMAANLSGFFIWILSTTAGGVLGQFISIDTVLVNYVLTAMFICMMVMQWISFTHVVASVVTGILSVLLLKLLNHNIALVIAAVIGSTAGFLLNRKKERNASPESRKEEVYADS